MIRLQLLGPVGLWGSDGLEIRPVLQQPKRLALLVYLVLAPRSGFCRRDTLLALFWPETDQEHARNALRQAVHFLRSALGSAVVVSRGDDELGIAPGPLDCDALDFRAALAADRPGDALDSYHGDLLPGFFVDAPGFENWLELERGSLRDAAVAAAWRLAEQATEGDVALHWARRAAGLTPDDEAAAQRLLRFLVARGDRAGALRAYETLRRRLGAVFGLSPSTETVQLVREIRAASRAAGADAAAGSPVVDSQLEASVPGDVESPRAAGPRHVPMPASDDPGAAGPRSAPRLARRPQPRAIIVGSVALAAVLLAAVSILYLRANRTPSGLDDDLLAVSPFDVADARYELWREGLMTVLTANLDGAGPLRTVPAALALRHWQGRLDADAAGRLGQATGAGLAVTGRVDGAGRDSVRIVAILVDAARGRTLAQVEVRGAEERFDRLTDSLTVALLRELGRTRPIGAVRSATIGSRSLPALKAFLRGDQAYRRTQWDSALVLYRQAVELDSTFAPALRRIGNVLGWQGVAGSDVAREFHARAGRFNRGLSPRDSLLVLADSLASALYGFDADPDWWARARRQAATLAEAGRRYPDDPEVWDATGESGFHFQTMVGMTLAEIMAAFDRAIQLDSSFTPAYLHQVYLAMTLGDSTSALRYAHAYLRRAPGDVTAKGIALFERVLRQGGLSAADSARYAGTAAPAELFEAWGAFGSYPDRAESAVRLARWLAARRWAAPMPIADPAFTTSIYARTLALRGHLAEAYRVAGSSEPELFGELAWLGAVPAADARAEFAQWLASGDANAARCALPWWSAHRDTAAIARFIQQRNLVATRPRPAAGAAAVVERDRAGYDVAAARAWLALARADSAAALDRFLAVPDSLCPRCALHRVPRAELLLRAGRTREARALLARELTGITDGPRPLEIPWLLARAEAAERSGESAAAAATYRRVLELWRSADPALRPFLVRARAGLERTRAAIAAR